MADQIAAVRDLLQTRSSLWSVIGEELLSPWVREAPLGAPSIWAPSLGDTRAAVEPSTIVEALHRHGGNKSRAAIHQQSDKASHRRGT